MPHSGQDIKAFAATLLTPAALIIDGISRRQFLRLFTFACRRLGTQEQCPMITPILILGRAISIITSTMTMNTPRADAHYVHIAPRLDIAKRRERE